MVFVDKLFFFFRAIGEDCAYYIPVLALFALWNRKLVSRQASNVFFLCALFWFLGWRLFYAIAMGGGSRYYQLPVILMTVMAPAAFPVLYQSLSKFNSYRKIIVAGLFLICIGLGIGKSLNPPSYKKFIPEIAACLNREKIPGILWDGSQNSGRFELLLPEWEVISGVKEEHKDNPLFWREFFDFIRKRQGDGKPLYFLLRGLQEEPFGENFAAACRREWGMFPFQLLYHVSDSKYGHELFRYTPPEKLFGLPVVTPETKNPYNLNLPSGLNINRNESYTLKFSSVLSGTIFQNWGGIEVDVRYGETDDNGWQISPDERTPEEFPLSITLYLPNGWPVGYTECVVRLVDSPSTILSNPPDVCWEMVPQQAPEWWHNCLPVSQKILVPKNEKDKFQIEQLANFPGVTCVPKIQTIQFENTTRKLNVPIFWIGSRGGGSSFVTEWLKKRNPELQVFRLEEYPRLSYSSDPRYTFRSLVTPRKPYNPLLNSSGNVDWKNYLVQQHLPEFRKIVLALGFEEVMFQGRRMAFHIDPAIAALRTFLTEVKKVSPECQVLLVLPLLPSQKAESYRKLSNHPYIYGFRWAKRHNYRRLTEGVEQIAKEFPNITVLPTHLLVPAGESERHPAYLTAVENYLQNWDLLEN